MSQVVKGIAASDGIGVAPAYLLVDPDLSYDKKKVDDTAAEYARVEKAFQDSISQLETIKENAKSRLGDEELAVFDAHIAILSDPEMLSQIKDDIESELIHYSYDLDKAKQELIDGGWTLNEKGEE